MGFTYIPFLNTSALMPLDNLCCFGVAPLGISRFVELVSKTVPAGLGEFPQWLKPVFLLALDGVAEATPLQSIILKQALEIARAVHSSDRKLYPVPTAAPERAEIAAAFHRASERLSLAPSILTHKREAPRWLRKQMLAPRTRPMKSNGVEGEHGCGREDTEDAEERRRMAPRTYA